jgi:putative transcriptional regulator
MIYNWKEGYQVKVGEKIKEMRQKNLLSQTDFAEELGVSFSTVNRWENNKAIPNYQAQKKIKEFCDKKGIPFDIDINIREEQ